MNETLGNKLIALIIVTTLLVCLTGCYTQIGGYKDSIVNDTTFIDDMGNKIVINTPINRIISLSQTHTTNLFYLGYGHAIVGVDDKTNFPYEVSQLERYSVSNVNHTELIVAKNPDAVLVTPSMNKQYPAFITALEVAGIKVISLMPDSYEEFSGYIKRLSMIINVDATEKLDKFYDSLAVIEQNTKNIQGKPSVFFESSEHGYLTPAINTLPFLAVKLAGGENIAGSKRPTSANSIHAKYGLKHILKNKENIDIYLSLIGSKDQGSTSISINQQPWANDVKALKNNNFYELNTDIINDYSFRYVVGVNELARCLYPDVFDSLENYQNEAMLTRVNFANIVMRYYHMPVFINNNDDYYQFKKYGHTYGSFIDVPWHDDDFDVLETIAIRNYLQFKESENGEVFERDKAITKAEIAFFINMMFDLESKDSKPITDIDNEPNKVIIEKVVANGLLELDGTKFLPDKQYTNIEFIALLDSLTVERKN